MENENLGIARAQSHESDQQSLSSLEDKSDSVRQLRDARKLPVPPSITADWARGREEAHKEAARDARRACKKEAAR
ncbi:hypothetical protein [Streptomyces sp. CC210A]|uniref:hypothetical protein n=1 Tax=Streptomyces sp. CC210A TaxID=2898184 RepID=UPI001F32DDCD|nr:hypothetical protein [Streptomyces sp. CC210A]